MRVLKKNTKRAMALLMVLTMLFTLIPSDLVSAAETDKETDVETIADTEETKKGGEDEVKVATSTEQQTSEEKKSEEKTTEVTTENTTGSSEAKSSEEKATTTDNVDISNSETSEVTTETETEATTEISSETTEVSTEVATTEETSEEVKTDALELEEDEIPVYHHTYSGYTVSLNGHTADGYWKISIKKGTNNINVLCMDHNKKMLDNLPCKNADLESAATTSKDKYFAAVAWALMNKYGYIDQDAAIPLSWQRTSTSDSSNQSYYGKAYAYAEAAYDASKLDGKKYRKSVGNTNKATVISMPDKLLKKIATNAYGFTGENGKKVETGVEMQASWSDNTGRPEIRAKLQNGNIAIEKKVNGNWVALPQNEIPQGVSINVDMGLIIPGAAKRLTYLDFSTYYDKPSQQTYFQRLACGYEGANYKCSLAINGGGVIDVPFTAFKCGPLGRLDDDCTFSVTYTDSSSYAIQTITFSNGEIISLSPNKILDKRFYLREVAAPNGYLLNNQMYQINLVANTSGGYDMVLDTNWTQNNGAVMRYYQDSSDVNNVAWYVDTSQSADPNQWGFHDNIMYGAFSLEKTSASWTYDASAKSFKLLTSKGQKIGFTLYAATDIYVPGYEDQTPVLTANQKVETDAIGNPLNIKTNSDGELSVWNLYPGDYYLIENQSDLSTVGSKTDIDGKPFTVVAGKTIQVSSTNTVSNQVYNNPVHISASLRKEDENGQPVAGAEFTLYAYVKNPSGNKADATDLFPTTSAESAIIGVHNGEPEMSAAIWVPVATTTSTAEESGDNVMFDLKGPIGYYMIAETKLPTGYAYTDYENYSYAFSVGTALNVNGTLVNVYAHNIGDVFPNTSCKNVAAPADGFTDVCDTGSGAIYQNNNILVNQHSKLSIQLFKSGDIITGAEAVTTPYGVYKRLSFTKKMAFPNVTFELWKDNVKIASRVTDNNGCAEFATNDVTGEPLTIGEYYLKEVNNGGSYYFPWGEEGKKITITADENVKEILDVETCDNEFVNTSISLKKKGDTVKAIIDTDPNKVNYTVDSSQPVQEGDYVLLDKYKVYEKETVDLEGAVFGLFASEDITAYNNEVIIKKDECVGIAESDDVGKVAFTEKLKQGKYYVKEIKTNSNLYKLSTEVYPVDVTHNNDDVTIELGDFINELYEGSITIVKVDSKNNEKKLEGVVFNLYDGNKKQLGTFKTNAQGQITVTGLPIGKYYIQEVSTLDDYVLDNQEYSVYITANNLYQVKTISNEKCNGKIKVIKVDSENHEYKLQGVVFELLDDKKNVLGSYTTDANGELVTEELAYGTYFLRETATQAGYILDNTEYKVDLTGDNRFPELTVYNSPYKGSIKVIKTNGDKTIYLKGVVFNLLDSQQNILGTYTTDENGEIYIAGLRCGTYYVQETVTNKGYTLDDSLYQIDLTETNLDQILELVNEESTVKVTDSEDMSADSEDNSSVKTGANLLLLFLLMSFIFAIFGFAMNENQSVLKGRLKKLTNSTVEPIDDDNIGKTKEIHKEKYSDSETFHRRR